MAGSLGGQWFFVEGIRLPPLVRVKVLQKFPSLTIKSLETQELQTPNPELPQTKMVPPKLSTKEVFLGSMLLGSPKPLTLNLV